MEKEKSCGAVIYKYVGNRLLFLIAKMNFGHFSLIKGHVEDGESELMTAYREIKEESNLDTIIDKNFREVISYAPYRHKPEIMKDVVFFVGAPFKGRIKKQSLEVDDLIWCSYHQALKMLTHDSDRNVLLKAHNYILSHSRKEHIESDLLRVVIPSEIHLKSYSQTRKYGNNEGDGFVNANVLNILERIVDARHGKNLPYGWVSCTYLWLVIGDYFIGEISIRHDLNDNLLRFGGHIGYRIRSEERRKGYGVKMLRLTLDYIDEIFGFKKVLITCDDDNIASIKVIEKNGGILLDKIINLIDGQEKITRRYWVNVK